MISQQTRVYAPVLVLIACAFMYSHALDEIGHVKSEHDEPLLDIRLPLSVQMVLSFGDQYLASNGAFFRAEMVATKELNPPEMKIYSELLLDAVNLNPYHEDAYYVAAATIPWKQGGILDHAQTILELAGQARFWDWMPPFFYGFNQAYFFQDFKGGAEAVRKAAKRDEANEGPLLAYAAKLYEKGLSTENAVRMLQTMADSTRDKALRQYLLARARRISILAQLNKASESFQKQFLKAPSSIDELVKHRLISAFPVDPLGEVFTINRDGKVTVRKKASHE